MYRWVMDLGASFDGARVVREVNRLFVGVVMVRSWVECDECKGTLPWLVRVADGLNLYGE